MLPFAHQNGGPLSSSETISAIEGVLVPRSGSLSTPAKWIDRPKREFRTRKKVMSGGQPASGQKRPAVRKTLPAGPSGGRPMIMEM